MGRSHCGRRLPMRIGRFEASAGLGDGGGGAPGHRFLFRV